MRQEAFKKQMDRLVAVFGDKPFHQEKIKLIFGSVRSLPEDSFEAIVTHFLSTFRSAPLPKDFHEAAIKERNNMPKARSEDPVEEELCKWCLNSGLMEIHHKQSEKDYLVRCGCEEGAASIHTKVPRWNKVNMAEKFTAVLAKPKKWAPDKFDPDRPMRSLQDRIELLAMKLELSRIFFEELRGLK